jgi:hypothetical protein
MWMTETPVHDLQNVLAAARLRAVEELAAKGRKLPPDDLQKLAILQAALSAVKEELAEHEGRLGCSLGGSTERSKTVKTTSSIAVPSAYERRMATIPRALSGKSWCRLRLANAFSGDALA